MTHRTIHRDRHHFGWNNANEPVLRVSPGETVAFEIVDAGGGQLTRSSTVQDVAGLDFARVNPVTGPVYVEGAAPDDALLVEILDFESSGWGWT
ncbi:MAG: acetamidase/formamidase family protein, partial [bacterium]